jgi:hypothetical protein
MSSRRWAIVAVTAVGAAGGGAAIAATTDDRAKEAEDAILTDAAERLDVEADELRSALSEAQLAQLDKAVEEGELSEEVAEAIKQRMQASGVVLGFPGGPGGEVVHRLHGPFGPGPGGPPVFEAIAEELGIPVERLHRQLLSGKSMRQIAEANGTTLAEVKSVAKQALEDEISEGLEDGRLTEEQADRLREDLPAMLERFMRGPRFHRRGHELPVPPSPGFGPPPREFELPPPEFRP